MRNIVIIISICILATAAFFIIDDDHQSSNEGFLVEVSETPSQKQTHVRDALVTTTIAKTPEEKAKEQDIKRRLFDPDYDFGEVTKDKVKKRIFVKLFTETPYRAPEVDDWDATKYTGKDYKYSLKNIHKHLEWPDELLYPVPNFGIEVNREHCAMCSKLYFRYTSDHGGVRFEYGACTNKECEWHSKKLEKLD